MVKKLRSFQTLTCNLEARHYERKKLHGRSYLVVPGVIIKEGVWTGNNGPILYTDTENRKSTSLWDHKPSTIFHPKLNGKPVTACNEKVLERQSVGFVLNTRNKNKALGTKFWLEEKKLKKVDPQTYQNILDGKKIEVSTGLKMTLVLESGVWNGKKYIGRATEYQPDHVAILPGKIGACSVKDGAGLYQINQMIYNGLKEEGELDEEKLRLVDRAARGLKKLISNVKGKEMTKTAKGAPKRALVKKLIKASNGSLTMDDDFAHLLKKDGKFLKKQLEWYTNESKKSKKRVEDDDDEDEDDIVDNADDEDDEDEDASDEADDDEEEDEEEEEKPKKKVKKKAPVKKVKKKAKNEADDEDEEEDDDEEPAVRKKATKNEKENEKEWLKSIPKAFRKKFLRMQQNEEAEKERLVDKIMANPRNEFSEKFLYKKELPELRAMIKLIARNQEDDDEDDDDDENEMFRVVAGGRDDDDDVLNEDGEDPDILPLPSLVSYNERLADLRKNDGRVGSKRKKEKVA